MSPEADAHEHASGRGIVGPFHLHPDGSHQDRLEDQNSYRYETVMGDELGVLSVMSNCEMQEV